MSLPGNTNQSSAPHPAANYGWIKYLAFLALALWYGFFLIHPIDLMPADLGRHLLNGRIFLSDPAARSALLHTNFYSAAFADFPFVNHHWGSGVIFYLVYAVLGFNGLTFLFATLSLVTLYLFFNLAVREAGVKIATACGFFLVPIVAMRTEIRPEVFSHLFLAIFLTLLWRYRRGELSFQVLAIVLFALQILWVNLHLYFFLGPFLAGFFWLEAIFAKPRVRAKIKRLTLLLVLLVLASCLNPSGVKGFLYPLQIFSNYGMPVQENQPLRVIAAASPGDPYYFVFKLVAVVFFISLAVVIFSKTKRSQLPWVILFPALFFLLLAWLTVRNAVLFGFFGLAIIPSVFAITGGGARVHNFFSKFKWLGAVALLLTVGLSLFFFRSRLPLIARDFGWGLRPNNAAAAGFISEHKIAGPLFNDYDSGGYLIFYLYPALRPLMDNRPECYPASYFSETYLPMQMREDAWKNQEKNFNVIFFSFEDKAPWTLPFIVKRLEDPAWAPVFADQYAIVFLKRNKANAGIIKDHEMPKSSFTLTGE